MSGAALWMAFASVGASTPFITKIPSSAVTLASLAVGIRLGLAAAGATPVLAVFAAFSFAGLASLLSAMTGKTEVAISTMLHDHFFNLDIEILSSCARQRPWPIHGGQ